MLPTEVGSFHRYIPFRACIVLPLKIPCRASAGGPRHTEFQLHAASETASLPRDMDPDLVRVALIHTWPGATITWTTPNE